MPRCLCSVLAVGSFLQAALGIPGQKCPRARLARTGRKGSVLPGLAQGKKQLLIYFPRTLILLLLHFLLSVDTRIERTTPREALVGSCFLAPLRHGCPHTSIYLCYRNACPGLYAVGTGPRTERSCLHGLSGFMYSSSSGASGAPLWGPGSLVLM